VELGRILAGNGTAISGGHGIEETKVGDVEQRVLVVDKTEGAGERVSVVGQQDFARPERAHVQPD